MPKQKDGRYRAKITVGLDGAGKPVYKYASGKTKRELEANKQALQQKYVNGLEDVRDDVLFGAYAQKWYNAYKKPHIDEGSRRNYVSSLKVHVMPELKDRRLRAIKGIDLQEMVNKLEGMGDSTITYVFAILTGVFQKAYTEGIINRDPTVGLLKPESASTTKRALTEAEEKVVLRLGREHPYGLMLLLLYYTGARRGEMLALQWRDIDFKNSKITINKDVDFVTGKIGDPKSKYAYRDIPMPKALSDILNPLRGIGEAFLIQSVRGSHLSSSVYGRRWTALAEALYLADNSIEHHEEIKKVKVLKNGKEKITICPAKSVLTAHYFRHNFASICYDAGVDVLTAQKYLGHADPKTTLDIYTHLSEAKEKQSETKLISVFDRTPDDAPEGKVAEKLPKSCRGEKAGKGRK